MFIYHHITSGTGAQAQTTGETEDEATVWRKNLKGVRPEVPCLSVCVPCLCVLLCVLFVVCVVRVCAVAGILLDIAIAFVAVLVAPVLALALARLHRIPIQCHRDIWHQQVLPAIRILTSEEA